jgi:hypothetical protein
LDFTNTSTGFIIYTSRNRGMSTLIPQTITTGGQTFSLFGNFNLKLFLYIVFVLLVEIVAIIYCVRAPMFLTLAIFIPLSLYIFLVYGFQWFGPDGFLSNKLVTWPPTLNSCPDFLVSYIVPKNGTVPALPGCIDTIGISIKPGSFPKATAAGTPVNFTAPTAAVNGTTATTLLGTGWFATKTGETTGALCQRLQAAGLTWEGIWDGTTCYSDGSSTPTNPVNSTAASCPGV